jgi:hypothetical protein
MGTSLFVLPSRIVASLCIEKNKSLWEKSILFQLPDFPWHNLFLGVSQLIIFLLLFEAIICKLKTTHIRFSYYIPPNQHPISEQNMTTAQSRRCERCADECKSCWGPNADQCSQCLSFEYWSEDRKSMKCVQSCPRDTYAHGNQCIRCQPACLAYEGDSEKMG